MLRIVDAAFRSDTGRQRNANEDSYFARSPVFVVADGMGGAQAGEVASKTAADAFDRELPAGPPDIFFLASIPLALRGLLLFPSAPATRAGRARTLLDGLIVASSVLFVSWMFVLGPALRTGEGTLWARSISLSYPVSDVVVITIVILAYVR